MGISFANLGNCVTSRPTPKAASGAPRMGTVVEIQTIGTAVRAIELGKSFANLDQGAQLEGGELGA